MKKRKKSKFFIIGLISSLVILGTIYEVSSLGTLRMSHDSGSTYTQDQVDELIKQAKEQGRESVLEKLREALESGRSLLSVLKELYPEQLVVASGGMYHWVAIMDDLKKNDYLLDNLITDDETGICTYTENGQVVSTKGIDVSSHQGDIDWTKVKADGVEFAFVRALYRGYGSGKIVIDEKCLDNLDGAKAAGLEIGVYVFSQAITIEEAEEEATEVIKLLDGRTLDLPVVFDVEKVSSNDARMNKLSVDERTDVTLHFLRTIEEAGYQAMVYHNTEMGALLIDMSRLEDYPKWFAAYTKDFYWPYAYEYWQYSESGTVDGIKGKVDLDIRMN